MKEKIVKGGTKIILFALDTEDTSVTGQLWMSESKVVHLNNLTPKNGESIIMLIILLTTSKYVTH